MNDHCPFPNLLAYRDTNLAFARHSFSLSFVPHEMSLNIDINRILPVKFSGVSSNLNSKRLTSSLSCNVLNPGKIFHSNSIGSPSILSKFLYFEEDFNHPNLSDWFWLWLGWFGEFYMLNFSTRPLNEFTDWLLFNCRTQFIIPSSPIVIVSQ